jgi:hypothetical protein
MPQNPTRQVRAVLGNLLAYQNLCRLLHSNCLATHKIDPCSRKVRGKILEHYHQVPHLLYPAQFDSKKAFHCGFLDDVPHNERQYKRHNRLEPLPTLFGIKIRLFQSVLEIQLACLQYKVL